MTEESRVALDYFTRLYDGAKQAALALDPVRDRDAYLFCVQKLARLASSYHPGLFVDREIEHGLQILGSSLSKLVSPKQIDVELSSRSCSLRILHVATTIYSIGGHTATIKNWAKTDQTNCHALFLTQQGKQPMPQELGAILKNTGGALVCAQSDQELDTAMRLRIYAREHADLVVLHHHPFDAIPALAFSTTDSPPIAVLNHASHLFWLGSSVADAIINLRELCTELSRHRRYARQSLTLPIPLDPDETLPDKSTSRNQLGLSVSDQVFATTGRAFKYRPTHHGNFFHTVAKLGRKLDKPAILCVGLGERDFDQVSAADAGMTFRFLGLTPNTQAVRSAADVYLEGFPFGSHTALLEAGRSGLPVVRSYACPTPLLASGSGWLDTLVPAPDEECEYIDQACRLALDPVFRSNEGERVKQGLSRYHWGDSWLNHLQGIYTALRNTEHRPTEIPPQVVSPDDNDIALAQWGLERKNTGFATDPDEAAREWLQRTAYILRNRGDYRASAKILWATARNTRHKKVFFQLMKLAPHAAIYGGRAKSKETDRQ